jgi:hypothetical protein
MIVTTTRQIDYILKVVGSGEKEKNQNEKFKSVLCFFAFQSSLDGS